jgi:nicotinate phosphoribosyltransferase
MAHEYLQAFQALGPQLVDSQKAALETWAQFYRGDLGIALTDVICMDAFLRDFDRFYSKLFDGMRHDSGDPYVWGDKAIAHYEKFDIDPKTKALVFSDSLDIPKAISLCRYFEPRIKTSYGIGTNLTCDLPNVIAINHVLKMTMCNGKPVAKLSDSPGKGMSKDESYVAYLKRVYNYPY